MPTQLLLIQKVLQSQMLLKNSFCLFSIIQVFEKEKEREDKFATTEILLDLLKEEYQEEPRKSIVGYPSYPLYREVANMLTLWTKTKSCPALDLPKFSLLDEQSHAETREVTFKTITPLLEGLETLWSFWSDEEIQFRIREVFVLLGQRGILDLLGLRKTVGTWEMCPPPRTVLLKSFTEKHSSNSILGVGARALSKHFHRDHTHSWWGSCTGTDEAKNKHALGLLEKIMNNAVWINIHWLPHDVYIIEMRQDQGYGMRWSADGNSFRGFLEPQMINGHEVGWRH